MGVEGLWRCMCPSRHEVPPCILFPCEVDALIVKLAECDSPVKDFLQRRLGQVRNVSGEIKNEDQIIIICEQIERVGRWGQPMKLGQSCHDAVRFHLQGGPT